MYPEDLTGDATSNLVVEEIHLSAHVELNTKWISPRHAPFYKNNFKLSKHGLDGSLIDLVDGLDYELVAVSQSIYKALHNVVYSAAVMLNPTVGGSLTVQYQTIGYPYAYDVSDALSTVGNQLINPADVEWHDVLDKPQVVPPTPHSLDFADVIDSRLLTVRLDAITAKVPSTGGWLDILEEFTSHLPNYNKPHAETALQIGLDLATDAEIDEFIANHDNADIANKQITLKQMLYIIDNDPLLGGGPKATIDDPTLTAVATYVDAAKTKIKLDLTSTEVSGLCADDAIKSITWSYIPYTGTVPDTAIVIPETNLVADIATHLYDEGVASIDVGSHTGWVVSVVYESNLKAKSTVTKTISINDILPYAVPGTISKPTLSLTGAYTSSDTSKITLTLTSSKPTGMVTGDSLSSVDWTYTPYQGGAKGTMVRPVSQPYTIVPVTGEYVKVIVDVPMDVAVTKFVATVRYITTYGASYITADNLFAADISAYVPVINVADSIKVPTVTLIVDSEDPLNSNNFYLTAVLPAFASTNGTLQAGACYVNFVNSIDKDNTANSTSLPAGTKANGGAISVSVPKMNATWQARAVYIATDTTVAAAISWSNTVTGTQVTVPATPTPTETTGVPANYVGTIKVINPATGKTTATYDIPPDTLEQVQQDMLNHPTYTITANPPIV